MGTFFYVVLAFLVGVLVGWFIWGRLRDQLDGLRGERDRFRADSDRLTGELDACGKTRADLERRLREAQTAPAALVSATATAKSSPAKSSSAQSSPAKAATARSTPAKKAAAKPAAAKSTTSKSTASRASGGKPDNLRRLIGIGPVNEKLLRGQGVTSFAQIAAWTTADIERIEHALQFGGRVEREQWVEQARLLAAGDEKEFARRFPSAGTSSNT
jgi:predicted flap endonuclease-1-like 5' DNA nuclease